MQVQQQTINWNCFVLYSRAAKTLWRELKIQFRSLQKMLS